MIQTPVKHYVGSRPVYYYCSECGSKAMKAEPHSSAASGQFYACQHCGSVEAEPNYDWAVAGCYDMNHANAELWLDSEDLNEVIFVKPFQKN